ncbi:hypothetical protein PM082_010128 [Marasmius tenuissimus]|nr:hypothetical protein PM082_010128 [Marasmius tenuissimus]
MEKLHKELKSEGEGLYTSLNIDHHITYLEEHHQPRYKVPVPSRLPTQLAFLHDMETSQLWENVWISKTETPPKWLVDEDIRKGIKSWTQFFGMRLKYVFNSPQYKQLDGATRWLDDECINECGALFQQNFCISEVDCAILSMYVIHEVLRNSTRTDTTWRIMSPTKYWAKAVWIIPIHDKDEYHWALAVIQVESEEIHVFDSFGSQRFISRWLPKIRAVIRCLVTMATDHGFVPAFASLSALSTWSAQPLQLNMVQTNGYDCGLETGDLPVFVTVPDSDGNVIKTIAKDIPGCVPSDSNNDNRPTLARAAKKTRADHGNHQGDSELEGSDLTDIETPQPKKETVPGTPSPVKKEVPTKSTLGTMSDAALSSNASKKPSMENAITAAEFDDGDFQPVPLKTLKRGYELTPHDGPVSKKLKETEWVEHPATSDLGLA